MDKFLKHKTPFFYFTSEEIKIRTQSYLPRNFKLYYSVKACLFKNLINYLDSFVDGFSVSSIAELKKTRLETSKSIHFVSPLIRKEEISQINTLANSMSFNSLEQLKD